VLPFEAAQVALDTLSLDEAGWVPAARAVELRPAPHVFAAVDIPLVPTRELAGQLLPGREVPTVAGVTLEIVSRETGDVQRVATFSDGEFYVSRVRPGAYEIRVAESSLRALNATADPNPLVVVVSAAGQDVLVQAPPITLRKIR
jgi:hypothetical protein